MSPHDRDPLPVAPSASVLALGSRAPPGVRVQRNTRDSVERGTVPEMSEWTSVGVHMTAET